MLETVFLILAALGIIALLSVKSDGSEMGVHGPISDAQSEALWGFDMWSPTRINRLLQKRDADLKGKTCAGCGAQLTNYKCDYCGRVHDSWYKKEKKHE